LGAGIAKIRPMNAGPRRMMTLFFVCALLATATALVPESCVALSPARVKVEDTPDDWGTSLTLRWTPAAQPESIEIYEIWRHEGRAPERHVPTATADSIGPILESTGWALVDSAGPEDTSYADAGLDHKTEYSYMVLASSGLTRTASVPTPPMRPARQYLRGETANILIAVIVFMGLVLLLVDRARRGAKLFIRRIAGLEAVEEAVGRATEMGRPILYIPGLDPMDEVATVAAIDILGQVARKAGEYETKLVVPNRDPIVMAVAQQVVRNPWFWPRPATPPAPFK